MKAINYIFLFTILILYSCKKDTTPPDLLINNSSTDWVLQEYNNIPSISATDNNDGNITNRVTIEHNIDLYTKRILSADSTYYILQEEYKTVNASEGYVGKSGVYNINYSVTDESGNSTRQNISITVKNSIEYLCKTITNSNITYKCKREKIDGSIDIGGLYTSTEYYPSYNYSDNINTLLQANNIINNKANVIKISNILGLKISIFFDTLNNIIIPKQYIIANENSIYPVENIEHLYKIQQNGTCNYNSTSFFLTYEIERYNNTIDSNYDIEFPEGSGKLWILEGKATYKETFDSMN